jgi:hypothetical protein
MAYEEEWELPEDEPQQASVEDPEFAFAGAGRKKENPLRRKQYGKFSPTSYGNLGADKRRRRLQQATPRTRGTAPPVRTPQPVPRTGILAQRDTYRRLY